MALLLGVAVLAWRSPLRVRAFGWLAVAPALFLLYPAFLWWKLGDAFVFVSAQEVGWGRELAPLGPVSGLWEGLRAGAEGLGEAIVPPATSDVVRTGLDPFSVAVVNVTNLAFLALFAGLLVVVYRRLDLSYAVYAAASLALPLSSPALDRWPLLSLPRFGLVVFPFFLALAVIGRTPGRHTFIVAASSLALGFALVQWALFEWVA